MQYHHHGYVAHDPRIKDAAEAGVDRPDEVPDEMDVLIVGAGPAGIVQAAQLTNYPGVDVRIIDSRPGRLEVGRADGLWSRSIETFQAFEFRERIFAEAQPLEDACFWLPRPDDPTKIGRAIRIDNQTDAVSEFPLIIVNQSRVIDYFAEYAANGPGKVSVDYGYEFLDLRVEEGDEYPVTVRLRDPQGRERTVRTKYVVGCDGSRSRVRDCTDIEVQRDQASHAWAVMDVLAGTDFPDVRRECGIQSDKDGSILQIPREGGHLVRYYVSLGDVDEDNRDAIFATTLEEATAKANRILTPYSLDVRGVSWYSVYEVRHTVTQKFDDVPVDLIGERSPRVFVAGDACHTHSAQAGQGMNVSIQDGWNLAWKLGQVLEGRSDASLLSTYSAERQVIAQNLIDFDREYAATLSKRPEELGSPQEFADFYLNSMEFLAGFATQYRTSTITGVDQHQELATGCPIGKRYRSATVSRVADASTRELGHHFRADGRWRLYAFADAEGTEVAALADWLADSPDSPVAQFTTEGADIDSVFDAKVIYQQPYGDVDLEQVPDYFRPQVGPYRLIDHEKVYSAIPGDDIFDTQQIDRRGALVIVRPDMYVAHVLPLDAREEITDFFAQSMVRQVEMAAAAL